MRLTPIILVLAAVPACGSRRIAGYLEDLENCSLSSSSGETDATNSSGASEDTASSSAGSADTTAGGSGTSTESTGTTADSSSTTEAIETTDTSTGEPAPICGNGVLEAFGPEPEECDDGNLVPDDGCGDTCALDRRVFVSSTLYDGAEVKSLYIADAFCANRADDQGWPDPQKYRAWLSDSMTDARDRLTRGRGRLVMANGLVLAVVTS